MANTELLLQYRTSDTNLFRTVVLAGEITPEQIQTIASKLEDHGHLIARQVGLPSPWEILLDEGYALHDDTDHVYTRLVGFEHGEDSLPDPSQFFTDSPATDTRSIEQLVQEIANTRHWDIQAELEFQSPHFADEEYDEEYDEDVSDQTGPSPFQG